VLETTHLARQNNRGTMTDDQFLSQFTEALGADSGTLTLDTRLDTVELWDSVAYLSVMTLVDESMGVALNPEQLVSATTPRSILEMARSGA
jgi:acyl carrier protein